ncbi:hypothetical protein CONLIGDRAFT_370509 [Coniochaeta ligniaria NRRL 30616]|uniref:AtmA protein n=1 Tax=Coniochaeta ligniaria NRRL 30616 TaxID=1408157 RepID=A0A1J7JG76_9PEZI|nr:hypothetical protein CONLIGDRAFT_370509 [Coniochaeta ligniaria NRRL 30616]
MAKIGTLRAILLPLIASSALVGGYAGLYVINKNGAGESIRNSAGRAVDPYISGGVHPFKNTYTGISAIDGMLLMLVPFFAYALDTPQSWAITASFWYLLTHFLAACCLVFLEGLRRGNSGRAVSWVGTMGFVCQNISYTVAAPLYFILHIFTSGTASPSVSADDVLPDDALEPRILLLSNLIAFVVPAVGMALPAHSVVSAETHYNWIAVWQFFPLLYSLFQWAFSRISSTLGLTKSSERQPNRSQVSTAVVYRAALFLTVTTHLTILAVALTPALALPPGWPTLSAIFDQVTLNSAIIPPSLLSPPTVDPKVIPADSLAPAAHFFLIWDVYCGSIALLLWAVYLRRVAAGPTDRFSWTGLGAKVLAWTAVGGPVAAAAVLLWERDEVLLRRDGAGGKKRL